MRRIHANLHPRAKTFDQYGLGPLGGMILLTIDEAEPVDIRSVVTALGRDKSQISRLVSRLEDKGLIARQQSVEDGRVTQLYLTHKGRNQLVLIQTALTQVIDELFVTLTFTEQKVFSSLLRKALNLPGDRKNEGI